MIGDRELLAFRAEYYGLLVSLLWREPPADLLRGLGRGIEPRAAAAATLHPRLGEGWHDLAAFLGSVPPDELEGRAADEFTRLFLGPFGPRVHPYESYYLTGNLLDRPLADLRGFLEAVGIARPEDHPEPEDWLAFELDVMRRLLGRQAEAGSPDDELRWLNVQAGFLKRHLLVWAPLAADDLAGAEGAALYRAVGRILGGFLALERELFESWGDEPVQTVDEARRRYAGSGQWRGPLFEMPGGGTPAGGADPTP